MKGILPVKVAQRFEYIDNMGRQEIWRHTYNAEIGESASIAVGKAATNLVAVVPFGGAAAVVVTLNKLTDGLEFSADHL